MKELWVEKYRPDNLDGYVFQDDNQKKQIEQWIKEKSIPNLLLSGSSGIGKTTLAKILVKQLGICETDILFANGSKEGRRIEWVDKLIGFCQTMPFDFDSFKVVIIDEADYLNITSVQPAMRNLMEEYSRKVRFILTCNYPNRIIPALHSRCYKIHVEQTDKIEFLNRIENILKNEHVDYDAEMLFLNYIEKSYPDLRKCINNVQSNVINNVLLAPESYSEPELDYKLDMVRLFQEGKISEARKLVCSQARPEEMEDIYRWLYENVTVFGNDEKQEKAILIIKQGLVDHTLVSDPEINLAATMIRLAHIYG